MNTVKANPAPPPSSTLAAKILNWQLADNRCGGVFAEPGAITAVPVAAPIRSELLTITATKPVALSETGVSTLDGNVTLTQPGRRLTADHARLYRDPATHQLSQIILIGQVHYWIAGRLLVGDRAVINLPENSVTITQGLYHVREPWQSHNLNAWGSARIMDHPSKDMLQFQDATYSTCAPTQRFWHIKARQLTLDREKNRGTVHGARFYIHNVPLFYAPYWRFPLAQHRQSGFLFPTTSYAKNGGADVSLPFYWALADNADLTLTPRAIANRGVLNTGYFRYLTQHNHGALTLSLIPKDRAFSSFQQRASPLFPANNPLTPAYLQRLQSDSNYRGFISWHDDTVLSPRLTTSSDINYVSDDYYLQDFSSTPNMLMTNQLFNQADVKYRGDHWQVITRAQAFQTLQRIDLGSAIDPYRRLPEVDVAADYPHSLLGLDYHMNSQFVHFEHGRIFGTNQSVPIGNRWNLQPSISAPIQSAAGFFVPEASVDLSQYALRNNALNNPSNSDQISRVVPEFDLDSGLYFQRHLSFFKNNFIQTLEPRVYYAYIPRVSQADIPIFDTYLPGITINDLFRANRFIGTDRIGDTNRVDLGLSSDLLNGNTGANILTATLGERYYIQRARITTCTAADCSAFKGPPLLSPLLGELSYTLTPNWSATTTTSWDLHQTEFINNALALNYHPGPGKVANLGYHFVDKGDPENFLDPTYSPNGQQNNLNRLDLSVAWPLIHDFSILGYWNENISHHHPMAYYTGLQYNGCCFALRFVTSRTLLSEQQDGIPGKLHFDHRYFIQIQLKGLGNFGNNNPSQLLTSTLPGYSDLFHRQ